MYFASNLIQLIVVFGYASIAISWLSTAVSRSSSLSNLSQNRQPSIISYNQYHLSSSKYITRMASDLSASSNTNENSNKNIVAKPMLDGNSLWRLRLIFQKQGFREQEALFRIRFMPTRGYEPPQGRIFVQDDYNGVVRADERGLAGAWTLSEDKDDRKDGLWICTFLLFSIYLLLE